MKPPSGGPSTGATRAGQTVVPIARIRSFLSVVCSTISRPTGTIAAPPMPCSSRAAMKLHNPWLQAHSSDAKVNSAIAEVNTVRAPKRWANQPLIGMNTASAVR